MTAWYTRSQASGTACTRTLSLPKQPLGCATNRLCHKPTVAPPSPTLAPVSRALLAALHKRQGWGRLSAERQVQAGAATQWCSSDLRRAWRTGFQRPATCPWAGGRPAPPPAQRDEAWVAPRPNTAGPAHPGLGSAPTVPCTAGSHAALGQPAPGRQPIWCRALMSRLRAVSQAEHSSQSEVVRLTCSSEKKPSQTASWLLVFRTKAVQHIKPKRQRQELELYLHTPNAVHGSPAATGACPANRGGASGRPGVA